MSFLTREITGKRELFRKWFSFVSTLTLIFYLTFFYVIPIFAAPPTSPYAPGETLDPSCAPGDTNCTVRVPIVGSGTANQISFFSSSTEVTSTAELSWDNANRRLGIGTTTPQVQLVIATGSPAIDLFDTTNSRSFRLRNGSATSGALDIFDVASGTSRLTITQAGLVSVGTSTPRNNLFTVAGTTTTTYLSVNTAGFVGIGTSTPLTALSIQGSSPVITLFNRTVSQGYQFRNGVAGANSFDIFDQTNAQTRILIDNTGQVLIGTSTNITANGSRMFVFGGAAGANIDVMGENVSGRDQAFLELEGSDYATNFDSAALRFYGVNALGTTMGFSNFRLGLLDFQGASTSIIHVSNNTPLIFATNDTERMRITGTGNIAIGSTTAATLFSVAAATTTNFFNVNSAGQVGIGTSTPAYRLVVGDGTTQSDVLVPKGILCVDSNNSGCPAAGGGTVGTIYASSTAVTAIDLAENYPINDISIEAGDVVALDADNELNMIKATTQTRSNLAGIISTAPGVLLGRKVENSRPVALAGRVPVKVNLEGGTIGIGDPLTASSISGVATKATQSGKIVGYALQRFDSNSTSSKILALVSVTWWFNSGENSGAMASILDSIRSMGITFTQDLIQAKNMVADVLTASKIITDNLEIKDRSNGGIYCVGLSNGDWDKTPGPCGSATPVTTASTTPPPPETTSTTP